MAFTTGNLGGIGRSRFRRSGTLSEINIVPLVDVVLVLLIIFMLTAHVMDFGLQVDVPKVRPVKETSKELPVVTLLKNGDIYLNEAQVNINDLKEEIPKRFGTSKAVYVKGDKEVIWETLAQVVAELGAAGFQVNMV